MSADGAQAPSALAVPAMRRIRFSARVGVPLVLFAGVVASWVAAAVVVAGRPTAPAVPRPPIQSQITYSQTAQTVKPGTSILHAVTYKASGGPVVVRWYDSDLRPTSGRQIAVIGLMIDGTVVTSTVKATSGAAGEDSPGNLVWRGPLARGAHRVTVRLQSTGAWMVPYVDTGTLGIDEMVIEAGANGAS